MTRSSSESGRGRCLVVATSACVAVILGEPGSEDLAAHLEHALVRLMPAAIRVELGIVPHARVGRCSTALAVVGVAVVAAVVSYEHESVLVREHGKSD